MQTFKINDLVYTHFGYGNLQNLGKRKKRIVLFNYQELTKEKYFELRKAREKNKQEKRKFKELKIKKYLSKKKKIELQNQEKENKEEKEKNQKNNNEEQKLNSSANDTNKKTELIKLNEMENIYLSDQLPNAIICYSENDKTKYQYYQQQQQQQSENAEIKKKFVNYVKVKLKTGMLLEIPETELSSKIQLYIKTFAEENKIYSLNLSIQTNISEVKNLVISQLNHPKCVLASKLFNPINQLTELPNSLTLEAGNIPNNAKLLLIINAQLSWDPQCKGSDIQLINSNLTAIKNYENDFETVLAIYPMQNQRNYWEVKIDKSFEFDDLIIGIALKQINLYINPIKTNAFWGFICRRGQLCGPNFIQYYGFPAQIQDIIGILLEYKRGFAELSFFINGINCGIAFKNLAGEFYPAVSMYYSDVQVTLIPKPQFPYL